MGSHDLLMRTQMVSRKSPVYQCTSNDTLTTWADSAGLVSIPAACPATRLNESPTAARKQGKAVPCDIRGGGNDQ